MTATAQDWEGVTVRDEDALDMLNMSDEDAAILWKFGGYAASRGPFPGARLATLFMLRGNDRAGRRGLARLFASLAPHHAVRLVLAVLFALAFRPAPAPLPALPPLPLTTKERWHRLTPTRAP
ncbi:hypothetical protein [Streptomyces sp. NK15101]|uniref:hypothetical protein n=1 Tax=Streptomyces sp. NK15101 TaxID=2873261 RepID=UPI001CECCFC7|nr:hypothetical protein [Streptomyces sp. NK15101]